MPSHFDEFVPSPGVRVAVAESVIRDLGRVSEWCDLWGMKLNTSKTKTMIVSRSRTMHPQSPPLTIGGTVLEVSDDHVILGVTFDSKMSFAKHLRTVSRAASQNLGILRKSCQVFHDILLLGRCFRGFVLPVFNYCSAVWCSAADTHLKLLDRVVKDKIRYNQRHPLCGALPVPYAPVRITRISVHLCASSLQNFAVAQDFYSSLSISVDDLVAPYSMVWD